MEEFKVPKPVEKPKSIGEPSSNKIPKKTAYEIPIKCVKSVKDMGTWQKSEAYYDLIGFINGISLAIQGKPVSHECHVSETMKKLLGVIERLSQIIDEEPPFDQPQRFGNIAYRYWFLKMWDSSYQLLLDALTEKYADAMAELVVYFTESFGNQTRIDYGTGHELAFIMFLCSLFKIGALVEEDSVACGLKLFNSYLIFARKVQKVYRMEPAGSQGVWSLDDYQFVPFIWGSAQLSLNSPFDPSKFLDEEIINNYKDEYMFIGCVDFITQVKRGHFAEHSNQLWSISAVQSWSKINSGLVKMYQKELLSKFPIIQHVYFGSLMSFNPVKPGRVLSTVRLGIAPTPAALKLPEEAETLPTPAALKLPEEAETLPKPAALKLPEEVETLPKPAALKLPEEAETLPQSVESSEPN